MIENLDKLAGLKEVELLAIRKHPNKRNDTVVLYVGEIKGYDYVTYDAHEKAILFLKDKGNGLLKIIDRIQKECFVQIYTKDCQVKIIVD